MIDITHKISSYRKATAQAILKVSKRETIEAVRSRTVPKGDVLEMSKAAGLLAIKKTPDLIPDCHPLPIEESKISYEIRDMEIAIIVEVSTIYKTGVEVEAMHGASLVALTMYDMLKPIDKGIEIHAIKLIAKKGGKSSFRNKARKDFKTAVIVISDSVSAGKKEDKSGNAIREKLDKCGIEVTENDCVPDDTARIKESVEKFTKSGFDLVLTTGGTSLSPRDNTPEVIQEIIDREIPGIMEAARGYGQQRTPYAMLSRGIAGFAGETLVISLPGSSRGAMESMEALFPYILHIFKVLKIEYKHQDGSNA